MNKSECPNGKVCIQDIKREKNGQNGQTNRNMKAWKCSMNFLPSFFFSHSLFLSHFLHFTKEQTLFFCRFTHFLLLASTIEYEFDDSLSPSLCSFLWSFSLVPCLYFSLSLQSFLLFQDEDSKCVLRLTLSFKIFE